MAPQISPMDADFLAGESAKSVQSADKNVFFRIQSVFNLRLKNHL
jgi:hypothetical protein